MKIKRIISALLIAGLILSNTAFAQENTAGDLPANPQAQPGETQAPDSDGNNNDTSDSEENPEGSDNSAVNKQIEISDELDIYENILMFIENVYIDDSVNKEQLMYEGINNLLRDNPEMLAKLFKSTFESLDMYSSFYTKEEYDAYMSGVNSVFYGIGVVITAGDDGYITINRILTDGPADKAGLKEGDKISAVDGKDAFRLDVDEVHSMIVGEKLTPVIVTVKRGEQELSYPILRDEVSYDTVSSTILDGNIGYIQITNFAENTASEFKNAAEEFKKEGVKKLILDLRNNPGGYMVSATDIASQLIPEGKIIEVKFRQEENNIVYTSSLKEAPFEICVLANANSASAAEILTSSIVESGAGILVGDNTYGKALVQDMYRLPYGQAMKMTIGEYITRNGNKINGIGIAPDAFILNERRPVDAGKYTAFTYAGKYSEGDSGIDVKAAEERLSLMGYKVGTVDEEYTSRTAMAVAQFQSDMGLFSYGVLDLTTQYAINNTFLTLTEVVDKQFEYAYKYFGGVIEEE